VEGDGRDGLLRKREETVGPGVVGEVGREGAHVEGLGAHRSGDLVDEERVLAADLLQELALAHAVGERALAREDARHEQVRLSRRDRADGQAVGGRERHLLEHVGGLAPALQRRVAQAAEVVVVEVVEDVAARERRADLEDGLVEEAERERGVGVVRLERYLDDRGVPRREVAVARLPVVDVALEVRDGAARDVGVARCDLDGPVAIEADGDGEEAVRDGGGRVEVEVCVDELQALVTAVGGVLALRGVLLLLLGLVVVAVDDGRLFLGRALEAEKEFEALYIPTGVARK
jgi:hypothetical protein